MHTGALKRTMDDLQAEAKRIKQGKPTLAGFEQWAEAPAKKGGKELGKSVKGLGKGLKAGDLEKGVKDIEKGVKDVQKGVKDFSKDVKELRKDAEAIGKDAEKAVKDVKAAAKVWSCMASLCSDPVSDIHIPLFQCSVTTHRGTAMATLL